MEGSASKKKLFIIGGIPRSGKSQLAQMLLERKQIPYLSLDTLRCVIQKYLTAEEFEVPISNNESKTNARTTFMEPYVESLIELESKFSETDFCIEGVNINIKNLQKYKSNNNIKIIFLGYDSISPKEKFENVRKYSSPNDWTNTRDDSEIFEMLEKNINLSFELKDKCKEYGFKYFDTSYNFREKIEEIYEYLNL